MKTNTYNAVALAMASVFSTSLLAQEAATAEQNDKTEEELIEEVVVIGKSVSYANNEVTQEMKRQVSTMTSVNAVIGKLPGVLVNEGDTFGADDWSTTVSIRGFQLSLDEQQIGTTIDGIANGNSNYGGGAKANRYIDTENLKAVSVSQGTADIAARSNEALGGSLNYTTIRPGTEEQMVVSISAGDHDAQKYYLRYETGELFEDTYAWISGSSTETSDWIDGSAENTRDHLAAKIVSAISPNVELTGYLSWDDTHEDNYQRISLSQFEENPEWDRLNSDWTGIPYVDQVYRRGWSTLRENFFTYLQADYATDNLTITGNVYYHNNKGRGDWIPPYLVDVSGPTDSNGTVLGGSSDGTVTFIDGDGNALAPIAGCESSITFPYGGAGPEYDPACQEDGAIPVGSYRHTHYEKERFGVNADAAWYTKIAGFDNTLRGGFWYEDYTREESRDWHKVIDSTSSFRFDHIAYWRQYDREFPVDTTMFYIEDEIDFGAVTVRAGAKRFYVELEREDKFGNDDKVSVDSDSDTLLSAGIVWRTPVEGLEMFAGYAENFAAIKDSVLEAEDSQLSNIEAETADNLDVGLRYSSATINASFTYYSIDFDNRLTFIPADSPDGVDYLTGDNGGYANVGGIESDGFEAAATWFVSDSWSIYGSYTDNDSEYAGDSIDYPPGNTVFGSAEEMGVLSFDWARDKYFAGLSNKWVGKRYMDAANTQRVDSYLVSDLYAGVSILDPMNGISALDIRLTVNNMFDESYLGGIAGQSAWIGAPRTAAVNITATF